MKVGGRKSLEHVGSCLYYVFGKSSSRIKTLNACCFGTKITQPINY